MDDGIWTRTYQSHRVGPIGAQLMVFSAINTTGKPHVTSKINVDISTDSGSMTAGISLSPAEMRVAAELLLKHADRVETLTDDLADLADAEQPA